MEHIDELIDDLIAREGDYVNHPADRGGPTRWGITEAVARKHVYHDKMAQLPRTEAAAIYKRIYWHAPALRMSQQLRQIWRQNCLIPASIWAPERQRAFCNSR
jgi:lysozyme family protein